MKKYTYIAALLCLSSSLSMGMDNKKRKNEEPITESFKKTCTESMETQKQKFECAAQSFFQNGKKDDSECLSLFHTLCIFDQSDEKIIESFGKITDNSQKYSHALIYIGDVFQFGRPGVRKNYTKAMALYEHAKSSNNPEALFALGSIHASGGCDQKQDFSLAFDFFIKASEQNHGGSMFELGRMFYTGVVCEPNIKKAFDYFTKAAEQNHTQSIHTIGSMFYEGVVCEKNYKKAFDWFSKAAEQNYLDSLYMLGAILYTELVCEKNYKKAFECFTKAAEQNHTQSIHAIGSMFYEGVVCEKNYKKAFEYFTKAAEQKNASSLYMLGLIFSEGVVCEPNIEKAMEYFEKGCWVSHELSAHALINILNLDIHTSQEKDTLFNLAVQVFENLGKYNKAMIFLEERMDINDHELHQNNLLNLLNRGFIKGNQDCMDFIISNIEEIEEWIIDDEKGSQSTLQQSKEREDIESLEYEILLQYIPDVTPETTLAECGGKIRTFLDKFNIQDDGK